MKLEILGKRFLIKPVTEEVKEGQIIMPDTTDAQYLTGIVIEIGKEAHGTITEQPVKVLFDKKDSRIVVVEGTKHYIVEHEKIFAIVHEEEPS